MPPKDRPSTTPLKHHVIKNTQKRVAAEFTPICCCCERIRNENGEWAPHQPNENINNYTHSICPDCADRLYGNEQWYRLKKDSIF